MRTVLPSAVSCLVSSYPMPLAPPVIKIVLLLSCIVKYPSKLWDHRQSCEEDLRRSTQTQRPPDARRDLASLDLQRSRHVIDRPSAHAGERCHDNAIGQIQFAHADWGKERLGGHDVAPGQGIKR